MKLLLLVAAGGAFGSAARYLVNISAAALFGLAFPWGTMAVNVVGSFLMGLVIAFGAERLSMSEELRALIAVGFLGGFATFSAFSPDFAVLFERKDYGLAGLYLAGSVSLSILALFAGLMVVRQWLT
ncbi:MAG: fluoride efflux transporter CrcB [Rhodomicrobiaceae bacterium]